MSHSFQTSYSLTENNTVVVGINKALLLLSVVERRDILHCVKERVYKILVSLLQSVMDNVQRHLVVFGKFAVKFFRVFLNSTVAVFLYIFNYFGDYLRHLFVRFAVTPFHLFEEIYLTFAVGNDLSYHLSEHPFINFLQ